MIVASRNSHTNDVCPECGARGVAIGAIIGAEPFHNEFIEPTRADASLRALQQSDFAQPLCRPKDPKYDASRDLALLIGGVLVGFAMIVGPLYLNSLLPAAFPPAPQNGPALSVIGRSMLLIAGAFPYAAIVIILFTSIGAWRRIRGHFATANSKYLCSLALHNKRQTICDELRYCQRDNSVFYPRTGDSVPAENQAIENLIACQMSAHTAAPL
jgi:hypothetical protein